LQNPEELLEDSLGVEPAPSAVLENSLNCGRQSLIIMESVSIRLSAVWFGAGLGSFALHLNLHLQVQVQSIQVWVWMHWVQAHKKCKILPTKQQEIICM